MQGGLLYRENSRQANGSIVKPVGQGVAETQRAISQGQVAMVEKAAKFGADVLDRQTQIAEEKFKLDLSNTIQNVVKGNYEKNSDNPQAFEMESQKQLENLLGEIPGERNKLLARGVFDNVSGNYYNRVLNTFQNNQDRDLKAKSLQFMGDSQDIIQGYYENRFNGTNTEEDDLQFAKREEAIKYYQNQKGTRGNYLFSEKEKISDYNTLFKQSKINGGIAHFNTLFENVEADADSFINEVDYWESKPEEVKKKYDLDQQEYNAILRNASAYRKQYDRFLKENEKAGQMERFTREKAEQIRENEKFKFDMDTMLQDFKIVGGKITNKKHNNIDSAYKYWRTIEEGYKAGKIDEKEMYSLLNKIKLPYINVLDEIEKGDIKSSDTVLKAITKKVGKFAITRDGKRDYSVINVDDRIYIINSIMESVHNEGIDILDTSSESKRMVVRKIQELERNFQNDKFGGLKYGKYKFLLGERNGSNRSPSPQPIYGKQSFPSNGKGVGVRESGKPSKQGEWDIEEIVVPYTPPTNDS